MILDEPLSRLPQIIRKHKALEVGVGIDSLITRLITMGYDGYGIEPSAGVAEYCAQFKPDRFLHTTIEGAEFDTKFPVIIVVHSLCVVQDVRKAFEKSDALLNKSGYLFIV